MTISEVRQKHDSCSFFFRKFANGGGSLGRHEQVEAPPDPAEPKEEHETAIPGWHFKPLFGAILGHFRKRPTLPKRVIVV